jgi:hypothetical protein
MILLMNSLMMLSKVLISMMNKGLIMKCGIPTILCIQVLVLTMQKKNFEIKLHFLNHYIMTPTSVHAIGTYFQQPSICVSLDYVLK